MLRRTPNAEIGAQFRSTKYNALFQRVRYLFGYDGRGMASLRRGAPRRRFAGRDDEVCREPVTSGHAWHECQRLRISSALSLVIVFLCKLRK